MSSSAILAGGAALDGSPPTDVFKARRLMAERESAKNATICPGCEGSAVAEPSPVTIIANGVQRTVLYVTCQSGCRMEASNGGRAQIKTKPSRFQILINEEPEMAKREEYYVEARAQLQDIIDAGPKGLKRWICREFRLHESNFYSWLKNGTGISDARLGRVLEWIGKVQRGEAEVPDLEARRVTGPAPRTVEKIVPVSGEGWRNGVTTVEVPAPEVVDGVPVAEPAPPLPSPEEAPSQPSVPFTLAKLDPEALRVALGISRITSPGDAIILEQLQQVAKERLASLSPTMADRVEIVMSLAWKGSDVACPSPGPASRAAVDSYLHLLGRGPRNRTFEDASTGTGSKEIEIVGGDL